MGRPEGAGSGRRNRCGAQKRPVGVGALVAGADLDAADDAILARGSRKLDVAAFAGDDVDATREVNRVDVRGYRDDLEAKRRREAEERKAKAHRKDERETH